MKDRAVQIIEVAVEELLSHKWEMDCHTVERIANDLYRAVEMLRQVREAPPRQEVD